MKVLTLKQPWASLVVDTFGDTMPPKQWETRSWKPSDRMMGLLQGDGFLIHTSKKMPNIYERCCSPWNMFYHSDHLPPLGCIIGHAYLGRVMTTHDWVVMHNKIPFGGGDSLRAMQEKRLGDYSAGRFAWELLNVTKFRTPIPAKGMLGLWNYSQPINILEQ